MMKTFALVASTVALSTAVPAGAAFMVTYEGAGVTNTTAGFAYSGVETFNGVTTGTNRSFNSTFGNNGRVTGTYTGVNIVAANQYGGAGGTGNFATITSPGNYSLSLSSTDARGINYFGLWVSALDDTNSLSFSRGGRNVFSFSAADVRALIGNDPAYRGNPSGQFAGQNRGEPYVFLNFFSSETFDQVFMTAVNRNGAGFESDNHTVGFFTRSSGTPVSPVPEPATWAMMIAGFGLLGATMRRRRAVVSFT